MLQRLIFLIAWCPIYAVGLCVAQEANPYQDPMLQATVSPGVSSSEVLLDERDQLYGCDFGEAFDADWDQSPDGWRRQRGFGYPAYNEPKIVRGIDPKRGPVLEMALDGQKCAIYSPDIPVGQQYSYVLQAKCKVELKEGHNCKAWASINFLDADDKPVSTYKTPLLFEQDGWYDLSTPLLALEDSSITHAIVGLHVEPLEETSLFGKAWFDDAAVFQLPRIVLQTGQPLNIFTDPTKVTLQCQVSGARRKDAGLQMELYDERGNLLRTAVQSLLPGGAKKSMMREDGTFQNFAVKHLVWKLIEDETDPTQQDWRGYYRLVIKLLDRDTRQMVRELSFLVIDHEEEAKETLFGWTLGNRAYEFEHSVLVNTLKHLGVNWVKLPVWIDVEDYALLENLSGLLQKLNRYSIDVVGVLDDPPETVYKKYWQHEQGMASLTSDVNLFQTAIEPVMTQLSLRIGRWQIGSDDDTSIAEDLSHIGKMDSMKSFFLKYGEEAKVGLPWTWMLQRLESEEQAWDFTSTVAYPELSAAELENYTTDVPLSKRKEHFISMQPLPDLGYDLQTRVRDYASRFIELKRLGVNRVFVPKPFDNQSGFFRDGEQPTEMLGPWKVLSTNLNGATYLGSFQMPGYSENYLFEKNGEALMLIWNDVPTQETLFLGRNTEVLNLWGKSIRVEQSGSKQVLNVDGWPQLVRKMDLEIARIRQSVAFDRDSIDSVLGKRQPLTFNFTNGFKRGISGAVSMVNDTLFSPEYVLPIKAGGGSPFSYTFRMQVNQEALTGDQLVRLDFKFHNEELPTFSAWQPLRIGLKEIEIATREGMTPEGHFIIKITLINRSEFPVSYAVYLYPPGQRRRSVMFHNVKTGQQSKTMVLRNAKRLIGERLLLSARESKGARNLNYRILVE